ncbi:hypothetical protein [Sinisalibacter lacisalsi]|nr:hypothetical protein [Sinisalibacter lacisalsi]
MPDVPDEAGHSRNETWAERAETPAWRVMHRVGPDRGRGAV